MNKSNTSEIKFRKKTNFRPIMLTSKSMKPVERSNLDKNKIDQKQQSCNESLKKRQSYSNAIYSSSVTKAQVIKKLTEQYREELIRNISGEVSYPHKSKNKCKPMTPSIVQVEFQNQNSSSFHRQTRYKKLFYGVGSGEAHSEILKKYFYCTSSKNYQNFLSLRKTKDQQVLKGINKSQLYKNRHRLETNNRYFNITRIGESKKQKLQQKVTQQKLQEISLKVEEYQTQLIKKIQDRFNLNYSFQDDNSPNKRSKSPQSRNKQKNKNNFVNDLDKIQQDITTKRVTNKKQHFVFGMSQTNKINVEQANKQKFECYKDFLWKINFSNGLYVRLKDQIESPYKLFVGFGNNSMLIKGIMRRRFWWQIVDKPNQQANLIWAQIKINQYFKFQTCNPYHHHSHKGHLLHRNRKVHSALQYSNLPNYIEKCIQMERKTYRQINNENQQVCLQNEDANSRIFIGKDLVLWKEHLNINKKHQQKPQVMYLKRIKTMVRKKKLTYIDDSRKLKIQNHFQCNYYLGNKKALFYSLRKYYTYLKKDPFDYIPLTFHISKGIQDQQYNKFLQKYEEFQVKKKNKEIQNIWIVKPGQLTNRGRGITVCSILDDIKVRLKSKQKAKNGQPHTYIVQKYIEKPLLYNKRKFDIRHYMMMTCVNHKFKGYWYQQGYLRTTSYEYNIKNCKDLYTHLTNDAIQKYSSDYGKFEKGNKLSYQDFQKYLNLNYRNKNNKDNSNVDKYDFFGYILPKMKQLAGDAMRATCLMLSPKRYEHNFELFGLDFMLDQDMNVYLIQVNTNPCLETSCPLLNRLIPQVVQNLFKITVDPLFPPPYEWPNQKRMPMGDNSLEENRFSLIFNEVEEQDQLNKFHQNSGKDQNIGQIDEEDQTYQDQGKQWVEDQK